MNQTVHTFLCLAHYDVTNLNVVRNSMKLNSESVSVSPIDVTEYNTQNQRYIQAFLDFWHGTMTFSSTKLTRKHNTFVEQLGLWLLAGGVKIEMQ